MADRPRDVRTLLIYALFLWIGLTTSVIVSSAQITRDVSEIAVIEGDNAIIVTPKRADGSPCPLATVKMQELGKKFYRTHRNDFQFLVMFTTFNHLLAPDSRCNETAAAYYLPVSNSISGIGVANFDTSPS